MAVPPSLDDSKVFLGKESNSNSKRFRILYSILRVGFALAIAVIIYQLKLDFIESYLYDLRFRLQPPAKTSGLIELVQIKPSTVEAFKGVPDFSKFAALIRKLSESRPAAVLLNLKLSEIKGSLNDKKDFVEAVHRLRRFFVISYDLEMKGETGKLQLSYPFESISSVSGPISADISTFAKDGVTRRMLLEYQGKKTIHPIVASEFNHEVDELKNIQGHFQFMETTQAFVQFRPSQTYPETLFQDIVNSDTNFDNFKNKIVIIGKDLALNKDEYSLTPFSRDARAMTNAEVHANLLDTLILNNAPIRAPYWLNFIIIAAITLLTVHVVLMVKPLNGLLILGSTLFGYSLFAFLIFWFFNYWLNMAQPLMAIFLSYYFFIPYRLIVENRRSWEYYQKNKLLKQVEELKTNFISMMSHDLKTPIARIQGMTDVILSNSNPLNTQQREAIDTIKQSSNDLLKFINSILNYGKIESQGVELHLQAKDINMLLEEVIKKHEFLAKLKRIQIVKELEPLFPVQLDPELISQVFSNLVENAIKYSPEDTKIMVTSEEREGAVVVQVSDQGPGIPADELSNIFMKFFRSKNVKSSPIKGSGLGLYLAKYFIELHQGKISVESSLGQGSTFTVEIPMEQRREHA